MTVVIEHLQHFIPEFLGGLAGYTVHEVHHRFYAGLRRVILRKK